MFARKVAALRRIHFYGTMAYGGAGQGCNSGSCGTVFKITPSGTLTTLHSFDKTDGANPAAGLIQGTDGNFYGTTEYGGAKSCIDEAAHRADVPVGQHLRLYL
jgi:uncharacterized repeat protein (TIGR03803 family)